MARNKTFLRTSRLPASVSEAFAWHARPGAFERLVPPWENIRVIEQTGGLENGARVILEMRIGPFKQRWIAVHEGYVERRQFRDRQTSGPFAQWLHTHSFEPVTGGDCELTDHIEYRLPFAPISHWIAGGWARRQLTQTFRYRHETTYYDLEAHQRRRERTPMKILISGATGLIGKALRSFLTTGGHEVVSLVRRDVTNAANEIHWNPDAGELDDSKLKGFDAVIHLAGENIAARRWSDAQKKRIIESRVKGTTLLAKAISYLTEPPKVFISASAVGFYGSRGNDELTEDSTSGTGFVAEVCREWEAASKPASESGIRTVNLRFGIVLTPKEGALAKMLPPFKMGVGGVLGDGNQFMPWIALDDAIGVIHHALINDRVNGPVNACTPNPVTNREFSKTLARVLHRPAIFPMPAFVARLVFGEMADELLLCSARVMPKRLTETAYPFRYPELEGALRHLLGKS